MTRADAAVVFVLAFTVLWFGAHVAAWWMLQ